MKEGYNQTELGVIPKDWEIINFTQITVSKGLIRGPFGGALKKEIFVKEGFKVYEQQNAIYKSIELGDYYITQEKYNELSRFAVVENDFILSCSGTIGRLFKIPCNAPKGVINQALMIIRLNKKVINHNFFDNLFNSPLIQNKILDSQGGALKNLVGMDLIRKIKFPIPKIEEQNAIANCLSTWDEAIEKKQKLIEAKEIRHKALMQKLLSGKKRLPGFTDEWKEYKFSDLIKEVKRKETWDDTKLYDLISVRRRSGGVFHRESLYGHQIEVKSLVKIKQNDFLISKMQIVHGASSIVPKNFEDYYVSGSYIILNIKNDKILSPKYLNLYSKQKSFYYQTFVSSYGVHIEKMTFDFKTFLKMSAIIPTLNEQNRIVEIIDTSNQELEIEKQKVEQLKEQKKALMQKLLTGKVRLPLNN